MQPIDTHIGRRIRQRREALGYDLGWVAGRLRCTESAVADWEAGRVRIGGTQLFRVARLLDAPLTWFFEELPADLSESDPANEPLLIRSAIDMLYANAPRADPPLEARMLSMARALELTAATQERISRQVMAELNQLLSQRRPPSP